MAGATDIIRLLLRGLGVIALILVGLLIAPAIGLIAAIGPSRLSICVCWNRVFCRVMGVDIRVHGTPPTQTSLQVSNHVSWLDIPVIGAVTQSRFVSKAEIADWPIIGRMARAAGTEFHHRGGHGTRSLVNRLVGQLEMGQSVTLFPEGTTTLGTSTRRFQPRLFAAAIEAGAPVVPVLLRYGPDGATATDAPYVGDDVFLPHMLRLMQHPRIVVDVWFLPALSPADTTRNELARAAQHAIDQTLCAHAPELEPDRQPALPRHRWST